MNELKIGDIVQLKSGGPLMTVNALGGEQVSCAWFYGDERFDSAFHHGSLELITIGQSEDGK